MVKKFFIIPLFLITIGLAALDKPLDQQGFTINFENVSIKEFLKFISKVGGVNVIYNEEDLNFNVTIVSEEETSLENVMSALVQILRINGLTLIEEGQNLLIHRNEDVKQIPVVVSDEVPLQGDKKPALMTKVFKIKKGNPSHIADLITPMLSRTALVEVSMDTRQLIITDVASSIDTVEKLLLSLDAPDTPYDVEVYVSKNVPVTQLEALARKILAPISETTLLVLVPQPETGSLFIVSTPFLIERSLNILQDLDKAPLLSEKHIELAADNVLLYRPVHKSVDELDESLKKIAEESKVQGFTSPTLENTINSAKYLKSTNSLMFIGPAPDLNVIKSFIASIDGTGAIPNAVFFLYQPVALSPDEMMKLLKDLSSSLQKSDYANPSLLQALNSAEAIDQINSILFTASPDTLQEIKNVISSIEGSYENESKRMGPVRFLIYPMKNATEDQIRQSLTNLADYLETNNYPNGDLIQAIRSMRFMKATHSVIFSGHEAALAELSNLLPNFDILQGDSRASSLSTDFIIYTPKQTSADELKDYIGDTAENLKKAGLADPALLKVLENVRVLPFSDQLIFTGDKASLAKLQSMLNELDQSAALEAMREGPYFIHLKHADYNRVRNSLGRLSEALPSKDPIRLMVEKMKYLPDANVVVLRGPQDALKRVQEVIELTDSPEVVQKLGENVVFITVSNKPADEIVKILHETGNRLSKSPSPPEGLIQTLDSAQALPASNTVILSGTADNIAKVKELIAANDVSSGISKRPLATEFVKVQNQSAEAIAKILHESAERLSKSDAPPLGLIKTLQDAEPLAGTNMIILSGNPDDISQAKALITSNDMATSTAGAPATIFVNIQNKTADTMVKILHETAVKLLRSESPPEGLINTLQNAQALANSNTVILSGTPEDLAKVKELIAINDTSEKKPVGMDVFIYKLKYLAPQDLQTALMGIAKHAQSQSANGSAAALVQTIEAMHTVPDSNTVQFLGSTETLQKLKEIISIIDTPEHPRAAIQPAGANVLVYRVQHQNPNELLSHIKQIAQDAAIAAKDNALVIAIKTGRYAAGTNSLVFTGEPVALDKIQTLLAQLDVSEGVPSSAISRVAEGYQLYKPQYVPGNELIQMVKNFEDHLVSVGVTQRPLAEVVDHLNYVPRTNTIIVSGTPDAVNQVVGLLKEFDTADAAHGKMPTEEEDIETIDETGFLIYKLQYQTGFGIVDALQSISGDLSAQAAKRKNQDLVDAIRSVKYIEITNSLLATGDPKVLSKLKELMETLDRPLKQVFIEILVIETANNHELDFGLRWGSQGAVKDRFSWGSGNYSPLDIGNTSGFTNSINEITGSRVPTGSDIPPIPGGFLGVIGDLIWHKGKSYASLGSLLNALQVDLDTTVVLSQKIVVQDNQNAKIFSGDNVPFTGSIVTTSGLSQTTNANLEYRNIGVTLSITPLLGDKDLINLDIEEEISEEVDQGNDSTSNVSVTTVNGIRTAKTSMKTKVNVPDRHFLVLSGTMRNQVTRTQAGIPCLGGLPIIGAAFSQNNKLTETRNVIIFVKPHVIKTAEMYDQITRCQEELYAAPEYSNSEDFCRGVEMVRTPCDANSEEE